jgi:hypothetical protein
MKTGLIRIWAGFILALFPLIAFSDLQTDGSYDLINDVWDPNAVLTDTTVQGLANSACANSEHYLENISTGETAAGCPLYTLYSEIGVEYGTNSFTCLYNTSEIQYSAGAGTSVPCDEADYFNSGTDVEVWNYETICNQGESYGFTYDAGTIGDVVAPESIPYNKCYLGCTHVFDGQPNNWELSVTTADATYYGCTYDTAGLISTCHASTPVTLWINYIADGTQCLNDSNNQSTPTLDPDNNTNIDLSPVVNEQVETNQQLQDLNDFLTQGSGTVEQDIQSSSEFTDIQTNITGIQNGTYQPFGSGFSSIYPTIDGTGNCPDFDLDFNGHHIDFSNPTSCQFFSLITTTADFIFFFITFFFIFHEWRKAVEAIA